MTTALDRVSKRVTTFVEFRFDDPQIPTFLRICDASSTKSSEGQDYVGEPSIGFELAEQTGGLDDKPFKIKLPTQRGVYPEVDAFAQALARPEPHSKVDVRIFEIADTALAEDQTVVHLCEGTLLNSRANPNRASQLVELEFVPEKTRFDSVQGGIPANGQCWATFGGNGCYVSFWQYFDGSTYFPNHSQQIRRAKVQLQSFGAGGVTSYRSQAVNLLMDPASHPGADQRTITQQPRGWWLGGYLMRNGLSIPIRDWWWNTVLAAGTNQFVLGRLPPKSWLWNPGLNNLITLVPGCIKSALACAARNNTQMFGGLAHGMPAYNPMIDEDNR